jgi:hypothetical protein
MGRLIAAEQVLASRLLGGHRRVVHLGLSANYNDLTRLSPPNGRELLISAASDHRHQAEFWI